MDQTIATIATKVVLEIGAIVVLDERWSGSLAAWREARL
jgi:hypothetical protein